ncbi:hypothetical protein PMIN06_005718 [Paraphaeosphaeria minitans]
MDGVYDWRIGLETITRLSTAGSSGTSAYVYMLDETMPWGDEGDFWLLEMEALMCSERIITGRAKVRAYTTLVHPCNQSMLPSCGCKFACTKQACRLVDGF